MTSETERPKLYVFLNNHFDPTWRRCWDRRFIWGNQIYVSYADLESYYMLDHIALAERHPDYKFAAESAIVARKFLERHPERREALVRLAEEGRFAVTGAGETIVDSNMILGESLVRNYLVGLLWVEETFNQTASLGVRNDAFGNSAQLPQILRECELDWVTGMSYTPAQGIYWRGLDGSTIVHAALPVAAWGGGNTKYPPCTRCGGAGLVDDTTCPSCDGRGIEMIERAWVPGEVDDAALEPFGAALVPVTPEELLPNPELLDWVVDRRQRYDVQFALGEDIRPYIEPWIAAVDDPDEDQVHPDVELNPNNSGCWVTRIQTKQTCRRQEYALLATETLAVLASLKHAALEDAVPSQAEFNAVWQSLFFTMFHDAITATHVDPAYAELRDVWHGIDAATSRLRGKVLSSLVTPEDGVVSVLNPTSQPSTEMCTVEVTSGASAPTLLDDDGEVVPLLKASSSGPEAWMLRFVAEEVPGYGARRYRLGSDEPSLVTETLPEPVIENARYRIEADSEGILAITDKALGRTVAAAGLYRPAELVMEHDEGSPWATLHPDQGRNRLSPHTRLLKTERGAAFERLIFEVVAPREMGFAGTALRAQVTVTLVSGLDRVDVHVEAHWDAFNHRLRLAMPVPFTGRHMYEIPYGVLERAPYEPTFGWAGANGDWPAINWAGVEGEEAAVALFNKGVPSYRMEAADEGEVIFISLLRSPVIPTYLHEPQFYTMTAWDGMRDAGDHSFNLALKSYAQSFADSSVVLDAERYNAGLIGVVGEAELPPMPALDSDAVRLAAVKGAERDEALVLRLHEFRGRGGEVLVTFPFPVASVEKVNLLERRPEPLTLNGDRVRLRLRPWEIATLRVKTAS